MHTTRSRLKQLAWGLGHCDGRESRCLGPTMSSKVSKTTLMSCSIYGKLVTEIKGIATPVMSFLIKNCPS